MKFSLIPTHNKTHAKSRLKKPLKYVASSNVHRRQSIQDQRQTLREEIREDLGGGYRTPLSITPSTSQTDLTLFQTGEERRASAPMYFAVDPPYSGPSRSSHWSYSASAPSLRPVSLEPLPHQPYQRTRLREPRIRSPRRPPVRHLAQPPMRQKGFESRRTRPRPLPTPPLTPLVTSCPVDSLLDEPRPDFPPDFEFEREDPAPQQPNLDRQFSAISGISETDQIVLFPSTGALARETGSGYSAGAPSVCTQSSSGSEQPRLSCIQDILDDVESTYSFNLGDRTATTPPEDQPFLLGGKAITTQSSVPRQPSYAVAELEMRVEQARRERDETLKLLNDLWARVELRAKDFEQPK